jgi:uncharacterized protein DUF4129
MTTVRAEPRLDRAMRWVPVVLAVVAEGAWLAVIAGLLQELVLREPVIGVVHLAACAGLGVIAARVASPRLGERWPYVALGLAVVASIAGVFASEAARAAVATSGLGGLPDALGAHPGGVLVGVAVLRGFGHAHLPLNDERLARLLGGGIVVLSLAALVGGVVAEPFRSRFLADTLSASLTFAGSALLALSLTRLTVTGAGSGADWPRNPVWVASLVAIVGIIEIAAAPAAGVAGPLLELAFGITIGPLLVIGLIFGWTRTGVRAMLLVLGIGAGLLVLLPLLGTGGSGTAPPGGLPGGTTVAPTTADQGVLILGGALLTIVGTIVLLILIRIWMRGITVEQDELLETRSIDRGEPEAPKRGGDRRVRGAPADAAAAYRALLADLAPRRVVRRAPGETPREHAHRLRGDGWGRLSLELLAADYAISEFAGTALSSVEHARAIGRWRRLRQDLRPAPLPSPDQTGPARRQPGPDDGGDTDDLPPRLRARLDPDR